jgi:flagellar biosynthesis GTPase FlhF
LVIQVELSELKSLVKREDQANETVDVTEQLDRLRDDILKKVENTLQKTPQLAPQENPASETAAAQTNHKIKEDLDEQLLQIKAIRARLNTILEGNEPSPEVRILKQVYFDSMYMRENALERVPAEAGTFEWILDESEEPLLKMDEESRETCSDAKDRFLHWLKNDNGVFHISGKAGSGKSTLMKLLLNHDNTEEVLSDWAGDKKLIFASFFFWKSSQNHDQCSLEGLYRSILFETLLQCPDLTREVFKKLTILS